MIYIFIAQACSDLPVAACCRVMKVSTSGFYAWQANPISDKDFDDALLTNTTVDIHRMSRRSYGSPRVHAELHLGQDTRCSKKRVERLMRQAGISGIYRRKGRGCTRRDPAAEPAEDLVKRSFDPKGPDRLWVMDVTEHSTPEGKCYLAVVIDAWSRRVVGWSIADHIRSELVVDALQMAIWRRRPPEGTTIAHSDHGSQGGINWSSQLLDHGGVQCETRTDRRKFAYIGGISLHRDDPESRGERTGSSSGRPIARGVKTEEAGVEAGVSSPVAYRWFRHAGGVNPCLPQTVTGRYLSFAEREDIAIWRAQKARCPRDRPTSRSEPVDDLARAAPQRVDADLPTRLQGIDSPVACRAPSTPTQGGQAGRPTTGCVTTSRTDFPAVARTADGRLIGPPGPKWNGKASPTGRIAAG